MKKNIYWIFLFLILLLFVYIMPVNAANSFEGFCAYSNETSRGVRMALKFIGYLIFSMKILIPILIILMGTIDLSKAVVISDDSQIKESSTILVKRIIMGIIIFFIPTILNVAFSLVQGYVDNLTQYQDCLDCLYKPNSCEIQDPPKTKRVTISEDIIDSITDNNNVTNNINFSKIDKVELIEWVNMHPIIPRGSAGNYKNMAEQSKLIIYDVNSEKSFTAFRIGGYNHMDVVPASPEDTATYKSIVGSWSWTRRAVIILYNDCAFAASVHAMPHGSGVSGVGFTIPSGNGYSGDEKRVGQEGHFCIHYLNSKTHGTGKVNADHQACVQKAYDVGNGLELSEKAKGCK